MELVKYLVSCGADIHTINEYALRWACVYGHTEVVKYLISCGAKVYNIDINALRDYILKWLNKDYRISIDSIKTVDYLKQFIRKQKMDNILGDM